MLFWIVYSFSYNLFINFYGVILQFFEYYLLPKIEFKTLQTSFIFSSHLSI